MGDGSRRTEQALQSLKRWQDAQASPERNGVWTGPVCTRMKKVSVVYYLSRNGHLEHPHFMEVPLSCPDGLYLKDVISRLNLLRGAGMGRMYSWSSKRSFKNGFVWHDLSEDDYIHPVHGLEYVLKGSEIPLLPLVDDSSENKSLEHSEKNQQWSLLNNLHEYNKVSKAESNASTQTDDDKQQQNQIIELEGAGSGSPPPVDSSPETLESLMKAEKRLMVVASGESKEESQSERLKASSVLMNLISCGSFSFRACGASTVKDHGLRLISHHSNQKGPNAEENGDDQVEEQKSFERVTVEDKEYFSGSVIETQSSEFLHLKRSSSYNADRVYQTKLKLAEKQEMGSVRAKCIPRKPEASLTLSKSTTKNDSPNEVARLS